MSAVGRNAQKRILELPDKLPLGIVGIAFPYLAIVTQPQIAVREYHRLRRHALTAYCFQIVVGKRIHTGFRSDPKTHSVRGKRKCPQI